MAYVKGQEWSSLKGLGSCCSGCASGGSCGSLGEIGGFNSILVALLGIGAVVYGFHALSKKAR